MAGLSVIKGDSVYFKRNLICTRAVAAASCTPKSLADEQVQVQLLDDIYRYVILSQLSQDK